jgi:ABC-type branched-subunit amino acid transport system substrate-binding protein
MSTRRLDFARLRLAARAACAALAGVLDFARLRLAARAACAALAVCVAVGCAQPSLVRDGQRVAREEAVAGDLASARRDFDAGRLPPAEQRLSRLLEEAPDARRADEALLLLGRVHAKQGHPDRAIAAWRRLLDEFPASRFGAETRLLAADAYEKKGRPELAREVLEGAAFERAPVELRVQMLRRIADLARAERDFPGAVRALAFVRRELDDATELAELDFEISELVEERLRDAELETLIPRLPAGPVHDRVQLELVRRQIARGEYSGALDTLGRLPRRMREAEETRRARLLEQAIRGSRTDVYPLGLLLPLTGGYAPFGSQALRGLALGLELFEEVPGRFHVIVRDTRGEPELARRLVRELVSQGARAIVGPMRSAVAAEAAAQAEEERVPLLVLSNRSIEQEQSYAFRIGSTPEEQAGLLVDYASRTLQARRFAILYPRDRFGTAYKDAFWAAVEAGGGRVVGAESYPPGAVDLQNEIKKLVGLAHLSAEERALVAERDRLRRNPAANRDRLAALANLPPHIDFDALFLPDAAESAGLILPQLHFFDVRNVAFLGPHEWASPKLLEIAGAAAEGAVFADLFDAASPEPAVQGFVARYEESFGEAPTAQAAEAYDAARILRSLIEGSQSPSSEQLRGLLLGLRDFSGVCGIQGFTVRGEPRKKLHLTRVTHGRFEPLVNP